MNFEWVAGESSMTWTYRFEAKSIQSWIMATQRLREMAGASEILHSIENLAVIAAQKLEAKIIQAAAGGATFEFSSKDSLEAFARVWLMTVDRAAPGLQAIQAWAEGKADQAWPKLQQRLSAQRQLPSIALPEAGPWLLRAGRTGEPAIGRDRDTRTAQDRAIRAKLAAYREGRDRIAETLLPDLETTFATEIEDFGEGYVAILHADANGIGQILSQAKNLDRQKFSEALSEVTIAAAKACVRGVSVDHRGKVLARPVVLGGDDFTIILKAQDAFTAVRRFLNTLETESQALSQGLGFASGQKLTACAGLALVKPGWPFSDAHDLAEGLCKAAKKAFRGRNCSGLAFHRVTTAMAVEWEEIRDNELRCASEPGMNEERYLTQNPYSLEDWNRLETLSMALSALPRGSFRRWTAEVKLDPGRAGDAWRRMREVADKARLDALDDALRDLKVDPKTGWEGSGETLRTPILDALEWRVATGKQPSTDGHLDPIGAKDA